MAGRYIDMGQRKHDRRIVDSGEHRLLPPVQPSASPVAADFPTPPSVGIDPSLEMDFGDAMRVVKRGGKVTKLEWNDPQQTIYLMGPNLIVTLPKNEYKPVQLLVSEGDVLGEDWIEMP